MLWTEDLEYQNAIRCYLRKNYLRKDSAVQKAVDFNVVKKLYTYIKSLAPNPSEFNFTTPLYGWWDLTSACNFRCIHCLYNDREYSDTNDLTTEEAFCLADELINVFGIACMTLTGGEIFLRKDTIDIIRLFKENNVSLHLASNAALLNDEMIEQLAELLDPYSDSIQISLDGASKEVFETIRRTNLFDKIVENIKKLTDRNVTVNISYVVNKINYHEAIDIYNLCETLGVNSVLLGKLMCFNESHKALEVSDRDLILLTERVYKYEKLNSKVDFMCNFFTPLEFLNLPGVSEILQEEEFRPIFNEHTMPMSRECNFHEKISIRSDGRVYMCMPAETCKHSLMGNFRENSLMEIWEKRGENILFKPRLMENSKCKSCKYNVLCTSGCKARAYDKFGDINLPEINCKFVSNINC